MAQIYMGTRLEIGIPLWGPVYTTFRESSMIFFDIAGIQACSDIPQRVRLQALFFRMLSKHERYYALGMDAPVIVCSRNANVTMVWAWML